LLIQYIKKVKTKNKKTMTKSLLTLSLIYLLAACGPVVETTTDEPAVVEETVTVDTTTEAPAPVDTVSAQ
jgi:hypothetical protein